MAMVLVVAGGSDSTGEPPGARRREAPVELAIGGGAAEGGRLGGDGAADLQVAAGLLQAGEDGLLAPLGAEQTGAEDDEGEHGGHDDEGDKDDRRLEARDAFFFLMNAAEEQPQFLHALTTPFGGLLAVLFVGGTHRSEVPAIVC